MSQHTQHPDSHTHGLFDGCPRCEEHAEEPFVGLDNSNLERLMGVALDPERLSAGKYSRADLRAAKHILDAFERAGRLAEANPDLLFGYLGRWGVGVTDYVTSHARSR